MNIPCNMKYHKLEYSRNIAQHDYVQLIWNIEYSRDIPEKYYKKQNYLFLEYRILSYGIFQRKAITTTHLEYEYS